MPIFVKGELWDELEKADLILVTSNASVRTDENLVMGRGAAREAAIRFPRLPLRAGRRLIFENKQEKLYGVMVFTGIRPDGRNIGAFQVKCRWQDDAKVELIAFSAGQLSMLASFYERIAINFPGSGFGRLARETVLPFLKPLPNHVFIYEYGDL